MTQLSSVLRRQTALLNATSAHSLKVVLINPTSYFRISDLQMVTLSAVEEDLSCLISRLQTEHVVLVPRCLFHRQDLSQPTVFEMTPPFAFIWVHHGVLLGLDHDETLGFCEILIDGLVHCLAFVIPLGNLGALLVSILANASGVTIVVGLEKTILHE